MQNKLFLIQAKTKVKAICSLLAMLVTLALAIPTQAQMDSGSHDIFQIDDFGNRIKVGEIYVAPRERGATNYVEHWVLFDNYIYPSAENRAVTIIRPSRLVYASAEDFFARVEWRRGFRYVRVDCTDTNRVPGR